MAVGTSGCQNLMCLRSCTTRPDANAGARSSIETGTSSCCSVAAAKTSFKEASSSTDATSRAVCVEAGRLGYRSTNACSNRAVSGRWAVKRAALVAESAERWSPRRAPEGSPPPQPAPAHAAYYRAGGRQSRPARREDRSSKGRNRKFWEAGGGQCSPVAIPNRHEQSRCRTSIALESSIEVSAGGSTRTLWSLTVSAPAPAGRSGRGQLSQTWGGRSPSFAVARSQL